MSFGQSLISTLFIISIGLIYFNINFSCFLPYLTTKRLGSLLLVILLFIILTTKKNYNKMIIKVNIFLYICIFFIFIIFQSLIIFIFEQFNFGWYFFGVVFNLFIVILIVLILNYKIINFQKVNYFNIIIFFLFLYIFHLYFCIGINFDNFLKARFIMADSPYISINTYYNGYVLLVILFFVYSFFLKLNIVKKFISFTLFFISLFILFLPLSRQNIAAFLIASFVIFLLNKGSFIKKLLYLSLIVIILTFLYFKYQESMTIITNVILRIQKTLEGADGGTNLRWRDTLFALNILYNNLWGIGIGNFPYYYTNVIKPDLESSYLQILVETGVGVFIIFILLEAYLFKAIFNIRRKFLLLGNILLGMYFMYLFIFFVNEEFFSQIYILFVLTVFYISNLKIIIGINKRSNHVKKIN